MKIIRKTTQFKKDFKHYSKDKKNVEGLFAIVEMLAKGEPIPAEYSPHPQRGRWKNHMECHVEDDYLLIWHEKEMDVIKLVRLGSHSELFE